MGEITPAEYDHLVHELLEFLDGDTDAIVHKLEQQMGEAADVLEFERAARLRDRLASVQRAIEKQQMVGDKGEDLDVIGLAGDDLEAAVQVFYVRKGRVVGRKGLILDKAEDLSPSELIDRVLEGLYADEPPLGVPEAGVGARSLRRSRVVRGMVVGLPRLARHGPRPAEGRQTVVARDRHPEPRRSSPVTD